MKRSKINIFGFLDNLSLIGTPSNNIRWSIGVWTRHIPNKHTTALPRLKSSHLVFSHLIAKYLAVAYLAIKTSEIRYKHFRDTKATNAFAYLSGFVLILTLIYWYFFYSQPVSVTSLLAFRVVLYSGHSLLTLLCQTLLFLPKVYPPMKRALEKRNNIGTK